MREYRSMIRAVLFDLDGVVRHFDPEYVAGIERRHGLAKGALETFAYAQPLLSEVTTGRLSRAEWISHIGAGVGRAEAAVEWGNQPSHVDPRVLELVDELRDLGFTTAILTNGTDTIPEEARALGLSGRFDRIFNSAEIGYIKPDTRAFEHVLHALGLDGSEVFFTDDSVSKLVGADALHMRTHEFLGVNVLRSALNNAGIPISVG